MTTDRQLAALKPASADYEASIDRGLGVRVYPSGAKVFEFRYRNLAGKRRRLAVGEYPDVSLATAREQAINYRIAVTEGRDPAEAMALEREAKIATAMGAAPPASTAVRDEDQSLAWLAEKYWPAAALGLHGGRGRPKTDVVLKIEKSRWKNHLEPTLGSRPYRELTRKEIKTFMRGFVLKGELAASSIAGIGGTLSSILTYAVEEEWLEVNPCRGVTKPLAPTGRTRLLDDTMLGEVWSRLVQASEQRVPGMDRADLHARLEPSTALALRFALLTLCRRSEAAGARWPEVNDALRTWTIPPERTKARKPHIVALSDEALEVLRQARRLTNGNGPVFPAPEDREACIRADALTLAMRRLCKRFELPLRTPHDFRRTGATTLTGEQYGIRRFIVSKVLSHNANDGAADVTGIYDLNEYLPEKRHALNCWGRHISGLAAANRAAAA